MTYWPNPLDTTDSKYGNYDSFKQKIKLFPDVPKNTNLQELANMDRPKSFMIHKDCIGCTNAISLNKTNPICWQHGVLEVVVDGQTLKTGEKKDEGKTRFELLSYDVLTAVARILTNGAKKYADRNWEKGISYGRVFGAAQRHLASYWNTHLDNSDGINHADGNESHIDHAICELMFLSAYEKRGMTQFDDRPKNVNSDVPTDLHDLRQG